jgi:uncharacterized protein YbjT (DUF2867 family)
VLSTATISQEECLVIVVTGATGNIGGELARCLSASGAAVRGLTRDAGRARFPEGVEAAEGDLRNPGSLELIFAGATALFLMGVDVVGMAAILEQARRGGVTRVVLVSTLAAQTHPELLFGQRSLSAEQEVRESGMSWTILRSGQLASNALWWAGPIRRAGIVRAPFADVAPLEVAESLLDLRGRAITAEDSRVLPTVEEVTGVPARTFRQWADDHAGSFR